MEAIENINGDDIERTIILDEEESEAVLNNLDPNLSVRENIINNIQQAQEPQVVNATPISLTELERICDEAVGIIQEGTAQIDTEHPITPEVTSQMWPETTTIPMEGETIDQINITQPITEAPIDALNTLEEELSSDEEANQTEVITPTTDYNTTINSVTTARFSSAEWYNKVQEQAIIIGGAGGISSWLAFLLSRTNVYEISIYDPDKVEEVNLAGQFFGFRDIGDFKTMAVVRHIRDFANYYNCSQYRDLYGQHSYVKKVMMCGFDNMEARKVFFNNWKRLVENIPCPEECLFIDGRLSAECSQVLCVQGDDSQAIEAYEEQYLFSDDMADATVCSYKQTSFMANMIAATMVNLFVNWCANLVGSFRPVPFFTEYDAVTMQYKLKMNAV